MKTYVLPKPKYKAFFFFLTQLIYLYPPLPLSMGKILDWNPHPSCTREKGAVLQVYTIFSVFPKRPFFPRVNPRVRQCLRFFIAYFSIDCFIRSARILQTTSRCVNLENAVLENRAKEIWKQSFSVTEQRLQRYQGKPLNANRFVVFINTLLDQRRTDCMRLMKIRSNIK